MKTAGKETCPLRGPAEWNIVLIKIVVCYFDMFSAAQNCVYICQDMWTKADQKREPAEVVSSALQLFCYYKNVSFSPELKSRPFLLYLIDWQRANKWSQHWYQNDQESEYPGNHLENGYWGSYFYFKTCSIGPEIKISVGYSFNFTYLVLIFHLIH